LNNLFIICGKSGSGKDHVVDRLCTEYNLKKVVSYTTRKPRTNEKGTHIFVTKKEFNTLKDDMCAYTFFNGNYYCGTNQQVNESDLYILDKKGIEYFKEHYNNYKPFRVIYIDVPENICLLRMLKRGDGIENAHKRVENDKIEFEGIEKLADIIIKNDYFNSCVCDIYEYMNECEKRKGSDKNK